MTLHTKVSDNPYYDFIAESDQLEGPVWRIPDFRRGGPLRNDLVTKYAWAIPSENALKVLVEHSPLVEIGAGTGYWASLITARGGDIVAYDWAHPDTNYFHKHAELYFPVELGSVGDIRKHPDRTLFLCWPPYNDPFAYRCLKTYTGEYFIYVGEHEGGCTGDERFFAELEANWEEVQTISIPQWWGIHDYMYVFRRNPETKQVFNRCRKCGRFMAWSRRWYEDCEKCNEA